MDEFGVLSITLAILICAIMLFFTILCIPQLDYYPLHNRSKVCFYLNACSSIIATVFITLTINLELPRWIYPWPLFIIFPSYVLAYLIPTIAMYYNGKFMNQLSSSEEGLRAKSNSYDNTSSADGINATKNITRQDSTITKKLKHAENLMLRINKGKNQIISIALILFAFGFYGTVATIVYENYDIVYKVGLGLIFFTVFACCTISIILLVKSNDSTGLKTEYKQIATYWCCLIIFLILYYIIVEHVSVLRDLRLVIFVFTFFIPFIFSIILPWRESLKYEKMARYEMLNNEHGANVVFKSTFDVLYKNPDSELNDEKQEKKKKKGEQSKKSAAQTLKSFQEFINGSQDAKLGKYLILYKAYRQLQCQPDHKLGPLVMLYMKHFDKSDTSPFTLEEFVLSEELQSLFNTLNDPEDIEVPEVKRYCDETSALLYSEIVLIVEKFLRRAFLVFFQKNVRHLFV